MRNARILLMAFASVIALSAVSTARADFIVTVTDSHSGLHVTMDGTTGIITGTGPHTGFVGSPTLITYNPSSFGSFAVESLTVRTNSPGAAQAILQDIELSIRNTSSFTSKLTVTVSSTGFTSPPGSPLFLDNALASSFDDGTGTFFSKLQSPNGTTTGTSTTLSFAGPGSQASPTVTALNPSPPFTLDNTLTVTLKGRQSGQLTGTTTVTGVVPEPGSWVLSSAAILFVGGRYWIKRRRQEAMVLAG